jgi:8-oxo-dGTP pyrophosphatase MutT (NUDIX family)
MNNEKIDNSEQAFEDLLAYFSRNEIAAPEPIAHPDSALNKLLEQRESPLRRASVLIPITRPKPHRPSKIILTVRSENLNSHAGQISLPGGSEEAQDSDAIATALRESEEEIGLAQHQVEVIGRLGDMALASGFQITPIIGLIEPDLNFIPCAVEVAEIFQAPLSLIMNTKAYKSSFMTFDSQSRKVLELQFEQFRIWGATAAILYHLAQEVATAKKGN